MQTLKSFDSEILIMFLMLISFCQLSICAGIKPDFIKMETSNISQLAKIIAAHGDEGENIGIRGGVFLSGGDRFSNSIDVYNNTLVIGAPGEPCPI